LSSANTFGGALKLRVYGFDSRDRRNRMVFKIRVGNLVQDNAHINYAEAGACTREIAQTPDSSPAKGYQKLVQRIAMNALLLPVIVMLALLVPAYSQQEINPTWYDPWAGPNKAVVQHSQSRLANRKEWGESRSRAPTGCSKRRASVQGARDHERTAEIAAKSIRIGSPLKNFVCRQKPSSDFRLPNWRQSRIRQSFHPG
jgi:hypothetical protein